MSETRIPQAVTLAYAVEQIHLTIDRIHQAAPWLAALLEPGRLAAWSTPAVTDQAAERLEALGHSDRAYRELNLSRGMSALPPSPAPVRLAVVDAQTAVRQHAAAAAAKLWHPPMNRPPGSLLGLLDWIGDHAGLLRSVPQAVRVDEALQRADRACRAASQSLDEEVEAIGRPCPACDRRSLQREVSTTGGPRLVRCVSQSCLCSGEATEDRPRCGCRQEHPIEGVRHVWLPSQLEGPHGLWEAIAAAAVKHPARRRLERAAAGHGGWQSRNMGGA